MENIYLFYYNIKIYQSKKLNSGNLTLLESFLKDNIQNIKEVDVFGQFADKIFINQEDSYFSISTKSNPKPHKLIIEIQSQNSQLRYFFHVQYVKSKIEGSKAQEIIDFIRNCIVKKEKLLRSEQNQSLVYSFLRPHLRGVKEDLEKLRRNPIVSYKKEQTGIRFIGIKNRKLVQFAINAGNRNEKGQLFIPVKFPNRHVIKLIWNNKEKIWVTLDNLENIPDGPNLRIDVNFNEANIPINTNTILELEKMRRSLYALKDDPNLPGSKLLHEMVENQEDFAQEGSAIPLEDFQNLDEVFTQLEISNYFSYLDEEQKSAIWKGLTQKLFILTGKAGTGKTEVSSIIMLVLILLGKRVLLAAQTNEAVDNFIRRIHKHITQLSETGIEVNLTRMQSQKHYFRENELNRYSIKSLIHEMEKYYQQYIESQERVDEPDFISTNNLKQIISTTYDAVNCTFGIIGQRRFFNQNHNQFDFFFSEASSLIYFSKFSIGGVLARRWMIVGDQNQLNPKTAGMFGLKQPSRVPTMYEKEHAEKFDPSKLYHHGFRNFNRRKYRSNVISLFSEFLEIDKKYYEENETDQNREYLPIHHHLIKQYRQHPDLHRHVCHIFQYPVNLPANLEEIKSRFITIDLRDISSEIRIRTDRRLNYVISNDKITIEKITKLIDDISNIEYNRPLSIGVMFDNVGTLETIFSNYSNNGDTSDIDISAQNFNEFKTSLYTTIGNHDHHFAFSSIESHEEKQYDIVIMGFSYDFPENHYLKSKLYTAFTRAMSYIFIIGPKRKIKKNHKNYNLYQRIIQGGEERGNRNSS